MTTRTFRQLGIGFGSQLGNITAKINDVVVYQGPVTTLNEAFPELPNSAYNVTNVLFSWTVDNILYTGPVVVDIQVDDNLDLLVAELVANYTAIPNPAFIDETTTPGVANAISSGETGYINFQTSQMGNIYIDDVLQTVDYTPPLKGQHWWELLDNNNIQINATIIPGMK